MKSHLFYPRIFIRLVLILWISASGLIVSAQLVQRPINLFTDNGSDQRVQLYWNDSTEKGFIPMRYEIEISFGDSLNFTHLDMIMRRDSPLQRFEHEFREACGLFYYRVRAIYWDASTGANLYSAYSNITGPVNSCVETPLDFRIVAYDLFRTTVKLQWSESHLGETYQVERSERDTSNFVRITPIGFNQTEYEDYGEVRRGIRYYYRLRARGYSRFSNYSPILTVYESPLPTPMQFYLQQILRMGRPLVRIEWKVDLEKHTHFVIERSDIDKDKFYEIGKVSGELREFIDEKPFEKDISYYRIKVMAGGDVLMTSDVLDAKVSEEEEAIIAYPNPFKDHITIKLPQGVVLGKVHLLTELTGKEILFELKLEKELAHIYPHGSLKEGYYIVYAYSEKGEELGKFRMLKGNK